MAWPRTFLSSFLGGNSRGKRVEGGVESEEEARRAMGEDRATTSRNPIHHHQRINIVRYLGFTFADLFSIDRYFLRVPIYPLYPTYNLSFQTTIMAITKVFARQIFDSRGNPTVSDLVNFKTVSANSRGQAG